MLLASHGVIRRLGAVPGPAVLTRLRRPAKQRLALLVLANQQDAIRYPGTIAPPSMRSRVIIRRQRMHAPERWRFVTLLADLGLLRTARCGSALRAQLLGARQRILTRWIAPHIAYETEPLQVPASIAQHTTHAIARSRCRSDRHEHCPLTCVARISASYSRQLLRCC